VDNLVGILFNAAFESINKVLVTNWLKNNQYLYSQLKQQLMATT
jgi:hypothetical protein